MFVAAELPSDWHDALLQQQRTLQRRLGEAARGLRWAGLETFHITLLFLGDTAAEEEPAIQAAVARAAAGVAPFSLQLAQLGVFGGRRPRVVWAGIDGDVAWLTRLHECTVRELGRDAQAERFSPHITLARVRLAASFGPELAQTLASLPPAHAAPYRLAGVSLMQSVLRPSGPLYTRRFFAPLLIDPGEGRQERDRPVDRQGASETAAGAGE